MPKRRERSAIIPIKRARDGLETKISFTFNVPDDYEGVIPDDNLERVKESIIRLTSTQLQTENMVPADQLAMARAINRGEFIVTENGKTIYDFTQSKGAKTMDDQHQPINDEFVDEGPDLEEPTGEEQPLSLLAEYERKKRKRDENKQAAMQMLLVAEELDNELKEMRDTVISEAAKEMQRMQALIEALQSEDSDEE